MKIDGNIFKIGNCTHCYGTGYLEDTTEDQPYSAITCYVCDGKGSVATNDTELSKYSTNHKCKSCGYTKGKHQANSFNCPVNGKVFTRFIADQVFVPSDKQPPKPEFTI
jgi:DnaJ-class molecular chaperone